MLAVKHHISELPYPVAQNEKTCLARKRQIEFDMAMTLEIVINIGMGLHVILGEPHQILFLFTQIGHLFSIGSLQSAFLCPIES